MTNPSPDAVEALARAIWHMTVKKTGEVDEMSLVAAETVFERLSKMGFTITRQPASAALVAPKADEQSSLGCFATPQRGAMTDAELEREAHAIAVSAVMCADHSGYIPEVERDIITLAKKYRG